MDVSVVVGGGRSIAESRGASAKGSRPHSVAPYGLLPFFLFSSHFVSFRFHFSFCWFDRISDGLSVSVISVFDWNIVDSIVCFFGSVLEHGPLARVTSFSFSSFVSRTSLLVLARNRSSSFGWGLG